MTHAEIALVAAAVADLVTTVLGKKRGAVEKNPLMRSSVAMLAVKAAATAAILYIGIDQMTWAAAALWAAIAAWNWRIIRKMRDG